MKSSHNRTPAPENKNTASVDAETEPHSKRRVKLIATAAAVVMAATVLVACGTASKSSSKNTAPAPSVTSSSSQSIPAPRSTTTPNSPSEIVHRGITATVFWVGEDASVVNGKITNAHSAWVEDWAGEYGGIDKPTGRNGYFPGGFKPKENPFYAAIPYNDYKFNQDSRKPDAKQCLEVSGNKPTKGSWCKNIWIEVTLGNRTCDAQIEDVGPAFEESAAAENDTASVFHGAVSRNAIMAAKTKDPNNVGADIDLSPAERDCLVPGNTDGENGEYHNLSWHFKKTSDVMKTKDPWNQIVTVSVGRPAE